MKNKFKLTAISLCIASCLPAIGFAGSDKSNETLYTLSNDAGQNEVLAFQRFTNGHMEAAGHFSTGGVGTGHGLGNQGPLALSDNKRYLFAVNAGSNDVSVFRVKDDELILVDRAADKGLTPVSVTDAGPMTYTLEAVAHLAGMHPEMLRYYCRLGLFGEARARPDAELVFDDDALYELRHFEHYRRHHGVNRQTLRLICDLWRELERLETELRFLRGR